MAMVVSGPFGFAVGGACCRSPVCRLELSAKMPMLRMENRHGPFEFVKHGRHHRQDIIALRVVKLGNPSGALLQPLPKAFGLL
jgi:hypothetical protein